MSEPENIDVDLYDSRAEAIQAALDSSEAGDTIVVCRGDWTSCAAARAETCEFCARVPWRVGLTTAEVMTLASAS